MGVETGTREAGRNPNTPAPLIISMMSAAPTLCRLIVTANASLALALMSAGSATADPGEQVPDFSLIDVNETSSTYSQGVSPRDYLSQVSAWYFGHAT